MGLDQYLYEKRFLSPYSNEEDFNKVAKAMGTQTTDEVEHTYNLSHPKPSYVILEVGYWRKSNQIHNWFVREVQNGVDDCGSYYVSEEKLKELRDLCKQVLDKAEVASGTVVNGQRGTKDGWEDITEDGEVITNPEVCEELLPSGSGFFFGSTNYDQYYLSDVKHTVKMIDAALEGAGKWPDFEYSSSW